jgi:hypothetical protein
MLHAVLTSTTDEDQRFAPDEIGQEAGRSHSPFDINGRIKSFLSLGIEARSFRS